MPPSSRDALESMVDAYGLQGVLINLSLICGEKSIHISHNWQDGPLAELWAAASRRLDTVASFKLVTSI